MLTLEFHTSDQCSSLVRRIYSRFRNDRSNKYGLTANCFFDANRIGQFATIHCVKSNLTTEVAFICKCNTGSEKILAFHSNGQPQPVRITMLGSRKATIRQAVIDIKRLCLSYHS